MPTMSDRAGDEVVRDQRGWAGGWRRWVFPGIWLIYLGQTVSGVSQHSSGVGAVVGYLLVVVFASLYLWLLPTVWLGPTRRFWIGYASLYVLVAAEAVLAHQDALPMLVYVAVLSVSMFGRWGLSVVAGLTGVVLLAPLLVPQWGVAEQWGSALSVPLVALAMFGFFNIIRSNRALTAARAEVARLAAENERTRIARDLHDLLGHSLTTISIKAQLARRLAELDPARAAQEIGEVEALARQTLTQVRAAVSGYREVSLAGELATAGAVLRAGGVLPLLPHAVDEVVPQHEELFGWVVREAVTNTVRHARATRCTITVGATWIEVADDGAGGAGGEGTGLLGLRERVGGAGGTVVTCGRAGCGWTVRVEMPAIVPSPAATAGTTAAAGQAAASEPAVLQPSAAR